MIETTQTEGVRFGRTLVVATAGDLLDQHVDALVHAANCRGVMGTGGPGAFHAAGPVIERLAMSHAPLDLGTALVTEPGDLAARGVRAIVHAVVHPTLGSPVRLSVVRRAIGAALAAAETNRFRSLAIPPLGGGTEPDDPSPAAVAAIVVAEIVGHLRRSTSRLERIVVVARFDVDAAVIARTIERARERDWIRPL